MIVGLLKSEYFVEELLVFLLGDHGEIVRSMQDDG